MKTKKEETTIVLGGHFMKSLKWVMVATLTATVFSACSADLSAWLRGQSILVESKGTATEVCWSIGDTQDQCETIVNGKAKITPNAIGTLYVSTEGLGKALFTTLDPEGTPKGSFEPDTTDAVKSDSIASSFVMNLCEVKVDDPCYEGTETNYPAIENEDPVTPVQLPEITVYWWLKANTDANKAVYTAEVSGVEIGTRVLSASEEVSFPVVLPEGVQLVEILVYAEAVSTEASLVEECKILKTDIPSGYAKGDSGYSQLSGCDPQSQKKFSFVVTRDGKLQKNGNDLDKIDEDGNVVPNYDKDSDGYATNGNPIDCNDSDVDVYPGRSEVADNEIDDNCNGSVDEVENPEGGIDLDGDNYCTGNTTCRDLGDIVGDCNDTLATINPGVQEEPGDGIDQDCNPNNDGGSSTEITDQTMMVRFTLVEPSTGIKLCAWGGSPSLPVEACSPTTSAMIVPWNTWVDLKLAKVFIWNLFINGLWGFEPGPRPYTMKMEVDCWGTINVINDIMSTTFAVGQTDGGGNGQLFPKATATTCWITTQAGVTVPWD